MRQINFLRFEQIQLLLQERIMNGAEFTMRRVDAILEGTSSFVSSHSYDPTMVDVLTEILRERYREHDHKIRP